MLFQINYFVAQHDLITVPNFKKIDQIQYMCFSKGCLNVVIDCVTAFVFVSLIIQSL